MKLFVFLLFFIIYHEYLVSSDLSRTLNKHQAIHANNKNHTKNVTVNPQMQANMNKNVNKTVKLNNSTKKWKHPNQISNKQKNKQINQANPSRNKIRNTAAKKQYSASQASSYMPPQVDSYTTLSPEIITQDGEVMNTGYIQSQTEMPLTTQALQETVEPIYPEGEEEPAYPETTAAIAQESTETPIGPEVNEVVTIETVIQTTPIPPPNPTLNNAAPVPPPMNNNIPPNCTNLINQIASTASSLQSLCNNLGMAKQNPAAQQQPCMNGGMTGNNCADNVPIGIIQLPPGSTVPAYCTSSYAGCKKRCTPQCPGECCSAKTKINKRKEQKNKSRIH